MDYTFSSSFIEAHWQSLRKEWVRYLFFPFPNPSKFKILYNKTTYKQNKELYHVTKILSLHLEGRK